MHRTASPRLRRAFLRLAIAASLVAAPLGEASAQPAPATFALDRFDPAPAGDRMFGVPSAYVAGHLEPHVMVLSEYAFNPFVVRRIGESGTYAAIVRSQAFLRLNGGITLWERLYLNVDVPLALAVEGQPSRGTTSLLAPDRGAFGDIRLGARVNLVGGYHDPFALAVAGSFWIPTGERDAFVSDGRVRGLPQVIASGRALDRLVYSAAVGPEIRGASQIVTTGGTVGQGTMFRWGAGLGVLLLDDRSLQLGAEINGALTPRDVQKSTTNLEAMAHVRKRFANVLEIGLGAGPGLASGVGTPAFRGVLMVQYSEEPGVDRDGDGIPDREDACPLDRGERSPDPHKHGCPPPGDRDGDGIDDPIDACPDAPGPPDEEPTKHGCPIPVDRDGDSVIDPEDACPDTAGVVSRDPKKNGCPPDRDGDGIIDAEDACPDAAGVASRDPKKNGCPSDRDGDGIIDAEDACPDVAGPKHEDPKKSGCPLVQVTATEVTILEQVQFDVDRATIKSASDGLLDTVAKVLAEHADLLKIEVQGHTDDSGRRAHNKALSEARAREVKKALEKRGIAKKRLTAKGFGPDAPIADNKTDEGRQRNRRVQFVIVERAKK